MARLISDGAFHDYWRADDGKRPYFHPSDAGLPIISLLEYIQIADTIATGEDVAHEHRTSRCASSLGDYGSQQSLWICATACAHGQTGRCAPHSSSRTTRRPLRGGRVKNARLGSLAAAARMAAPLFASDPAFQSQLETYAWNQLHWILGRNPFDCEHAHGQRPR